MHDRLGLHWTVGGLPAAPALSVEQVFQIRSEGDSSCDEGACGDLNVCKVLIALRRPGGVLWLPY